MPLNAGRPHAGFKSAVVPTGHSYPLGLELSQMRANDLDEYMKLAEECSRFAKQAQTTANRERWLALAAAWKAMAAAQSGIRAKSRKELRSASLAVPD